MITSHDARSKSNGHLIGAKIGGMIARALLPGIRSAC
jgi:hypothetical protein